jgi:hypothetical protein
LSQVLFRKSGVWCRLRGNAQFVLQAHNQSTKFKRSSVVFLRRFQDAQSCCSFFGPYTDKMAKKMPVRRGQRPRERRFRNLTKILHQGTPPKRFKQLPKCSPGPKPLPKTHERPADLSLMSTQASRVACRIRAGDFEYSSWQLQHQRVEAGKGRRWQPKVGKKYTFAGRRRFLRGSVKAVRICRLNRGKNCDSVPFFIVEFDVDGKLHVVGSNLVKPDPKRGKK